MADFLRVAIDGPAGAGKSTVARLLAERLGFLFLDTGALYRAATLGCIRRGVSLKNEFAALNAVAEMKLELRDGTPFLEGENVSDEIRRPGLTAKVRHLAANGKVRKIVTEAARKSAVGRNIVAEGRDAGTVIFPDAQLKIYLDASAKERAKRRCEELLEKGENVDFESVYEAINRRDESDFLRKDDPLKVAPGAEIVDTTDLSIEQVLDKLEKLVEERIAEQG